MSFNINRINNRILEKNLQINTTPNANNLIQSTGTTNNSKIASVSTLSLNNIQITANANQLNSTKISTFGVAEESKLLILDSSRNISNINNISCTTLIANGQNITAAMFQVGGSDDINNEYLTNIFSTGNTLSLKALTTNNLNNIENINSISINILQLNNTNIINSSKYNTNLIINKYENLYPNIHSLNSQYFNVSNCISISTNLLTNNNTDSTIINDYKWGGLAWSSDLLLYVSVSTGNLNNIPQLNSIMTSKDGHNWIIQTAPIANSWVDVIWINKLRLFVSVSSSGTNNQIMTSINGINWVSRTTPTVNITFTKLIWSNELGICIAIANQSKNYILYSYDCINWYGTNSNLPPNIGLSCITWSPELGLFVAVTSDTYLSFYRIVISTNGINWNYLPNVIIDGQPYSICWSSYMKSFIIGNTSTTVIKYSNDGYNWFNIQVSGITNSLFIYSISWIDELKLFIGHVTNPSYEYIIYSKNGINWNIGIDSNLSSRSKSKNIIWSPELGQIIISMYEGVNSTSSSNHRFLIINTNYNKKKSNYTFYKNSLIIDNNNNRIGFNTNNPNKSIEINSENGNLLKLSSHSNYITYNTTFNVTSNGQLNINTSIFNILTDYSTYGLKLNNILITTNVNSLNSLSSITNGIGGKQLPLITDSNNNISNINIISCNSLIINGNNINTNANNALFLNNNIGIATPNKVLITNDNNNISNINILNYNNIKINNNKLIINTSQSNLNHNLTNINKIINNPNIENLYTSYALSLNNIRSISVPNCIWKSAIWVSELQLYIAIASSNSTNSNRIFTSPDNITWTANSESKLVTENTSWNCITWSPELKMLVALNSSFSSYRIAISYDGFNWFPQHNISELDKSWQSICWSSELNLFVAISDDGVIMVSENGLYWTKSYGHSSSINLKQIIWANKLKLFIIITNQTSNTQILTSSNGYNWNIINLQNTSPELESISWSEDLNLLLISTTTNSVFYYSYNGLSWNNYIINSGLLVGIRTRLTWIKDLSLFIVFNSFASYQFAYSMDGFNWYRSSFTLSIVPQAIAWSSDLKRLVILNGTTCLAFNTLYSTNAMNTIVQQSNEFKINKSNGYIGLGINPSYQLELSTDSAAKASSSTWTITSDERLKENIENADLDICYTNFKNINLVRYKWMNNIYSNDQINDRTQLGWIAQDIEQILPKSVITCNKFGFEDCKFLNSDQLLSTLYGTVQKLINNFDNQENNINNLQTELNNIDTFLNSLEIDS